MNWDFLTRKWRRVVDYVKGESGDHDSQDDASESSLLGIDWPGREGRIAFPPVMGPALARIPKR